MTDHPDRTADEITRNTRIRVRKRVLDASDPHYDDLAGRPPVHTFNTELTAGRGAWIWRMSNLQRDRIVFLVDVEALGTQGVS